MAGRIITVAQQKGGSGKTTLAAHLAVAFLKRHAPVAILDVDPQGSLGKWYEARERRLGENETGITFRTASGWGARREARSLARDHALVLVDTPPKTDSESRPAIEVASLVAVPIQPSPVDIWATAPTLAMAKAENVRALLVMNRVPQRALLTGEMAKAVRALGSRVAQGQLGNRVGFAASMGVGSTVLELQPGGKGTQEVESLAREIACALG